MADFQFDPLTSHLTEKNNNAVGRKCSFITLCTTYYFINNYKRFNSVKRKQLSQVHNCKNKQFRTNQPKSGKNSIPHVKHVYSIVYIFVHIFRYFMWYYNCLPPDQHNIYIFVITMYIVSNHHWFLNKIPTLCRSFLMYQLHKCTSVPDLVHTNEQFNINFLKLPTILALCSALYIGTKHSICHLTGICISCRFIKSSEIIWMTTKELL